VKDIDQTPAVAAYTGLAPKTLENMRWRREGPPYVKLGGRVLYRKVDVDAWLEQHLVQPRGAA